MNRQEIIQLRLFNQGLSVNHFEKPEEVVAHFGAMQAQDYSMALWAVGLRLKNAKQIAVESCLNRGEVIRTHILRPTWHLVHHKDIRWMMELSAPYLKKATQYIDKKVGLTNELFKKAWKIIEWQFRENDDLTKADIMSCLSKHHIVATNLLATQIIIRAELEMLLCNGEKKGTYALFEKKVPTTASISKTEAISKLTHLYFHSRGPATLRDFVWWSGLSLTDAKKGIVELGNQLDYFMYNDLQYYYLKVDKILRKKISVLLPNYDEYTVSYSEGRKIVLPEHFDHSKIGNGVFKPIILHKNEIVGTWAKSNKSPFVEIQTLREDKEFRIRKMPELIEQYKLFNNFNG